MSQYRISALVGVQRSGCLANLAGWLVSAALMTLFQAAPPRAGAAEPESQQDIESLRGIVYRQRAETIGMAIDTPGIWIGLPTNSSYLGGHLLSTSGNVESSQSLGIAKMKIGQTTYYLFELTSNHAGRTDSRILDAVVAPSGTAMQPCDVMGVGSEELAAILDLDEARMVAAQQPSRMDQKPAVLANPQRLVRFNSRSLRIERVISDQARCVGYPF